MTWMMVLPASGTKPHRMVSASPSAIVGLGLAALVLHAPVPFIKCSRAAYGKVDHTDRLGRVSSLSGLIASIENLPMSAVKSVAGRASPP